MFRYLVRPLLFRFPPESAHHLAAFALKLLCYIPGIPSLLRGYYGSNNPNLAVSKRGLHVPNPVGLAAGFDKNATLFPSFRHLGFGFIEVGTVTPLAQPGNPKPRLFRLPADQALINRMGFNNDGVEAMKARLQYRPNNLVIGANLGKNKNTPEDQAVNDYVLGFRSLYAHADYFVVNVSSPNTPGLRALQDREPLSRILNTLVEERSRQAISKPILLKIAPDLSQEQVLDIASIVKETGIDGVIATNTTISRDGLQTPANEIERAGAGGLSGWPVRARSTEIVRMLRKNLGESYLIIGCGGIERAEDALEKLEAGADLIQIYTGFIYEGPALIRSILKKLH